MSIKLTWVAPAKHTSGRAIKTGELTGYKLSMRVEGAPSFTQIATPAPAATTFTVDVSDAGLYEFQLIATASNGTTSAAAVGSITIADTSALEAPTSFTVALV